MNDWIELKMNYEDIYGVRMIILLEAEPQSNKYNQILLNGKQFKEVSDTVSRVFGESKVDDGYTMAPIKLSDEEYELPDISEIDGEYIEHGKDK